MELMIFILIIFVIVFSGIISYIASAFHTCDDDDVIDYINKEEK